MALTRLLPAVAIALAAAIVPAAAQSDAATFPNRAIRIIVPFPPGGRPTSSRVSSASA
jgi:tripartite-type tricarboxylate transporter receptor subunit TctC